MREATAMGGQDGALAESVQMHVANVCVISVTWQTKADANM